MMAKYRTIVAKMETKRQKEKQESKRESQKVWKKKSINGGK
jgi:hypothetical protein